MISRRIGGIVLVAGLFVAHSALAADPIKVGVTVALSPPGSVSQGTQSRDAVEVATKMINDAGGVLGRPIELIVEDHQGIPDKARAAMEKLITRDKVIAVVGEHQSSTALASIEVAHRYHVPYVNVGAAADAIREKGYVEVFNPAPFNTLLAIGVADAMNGLGARRVVALCENTDFGISLGKAIGDQIKERAPGIEYKYEALDRAGKDFLPVLLPMKANPPDVVVDCMLAPAAFILINQLYEQGITPKTWLYEVPNADYPDFWQNVSEAAKGMLAFGLYHPKMPMPELGQKLAIAYKAKTTYDPNRLLFSGADSMFLVARTITTAKSTEPDALINVLETLKWTGTRGEISFSLEKRGYRYHQWLDHPHVTYQITTVKQPLAETRILQDGSKPFDSSQLVKPQ
jgi:branched-chain amino acid transport system substrate-binding protein